MSKDWRTIGRFAVVGIAIATIFFVFDKTDYFTKSGAGIWMFWASVVICPGFFVFGWWMAITEQPIQNVELMWLMTGLINCLFYAAIGAAYVRLRRRRDGMPRI